jgi:hypothetical protein
MLLRENIALDTCTSALTAGQMSSTNGSTYKQKSGKGRRFRVTKPVRFSSTIMTFLQPLHDSVGYKRRSDTAASG